jgi:hypothetical protein
MTLQYKMSSKYKFSTEKWEEIKPGVTYNIQCCDCGLVHVYEYKIVTGKVYVSTTRNERATGQVRRHLKKQS